MKIVQLLLLATSLLHAFEPAKSFVQANETPILISVDNDRAGTIEMRYALPAPKRISSSYQMRNNKVATRVSFSTGHALTKPGEPLIPAIPARLILPHGHTIEKIILTPSITDTVEGKHHLTYAEIPQPISTPNVRWATPLEEIYSSDDIYPSTFYKAFGVQKAFGVSVVTIHIYPVQYRPLSGELTYFKEFTLSVKTREDTTVGAKGNGVRVRLDRFKEQCQSFENPEMLETYPDGELRGEYQRVITRDDTYDYILITSKEIISEAGDAVQALIEKRKKDSLTCLIKTIEEINTEYSASIEQDRIRAFIKDAYNNYNTRFITLGGDTNYVQVYMPDVYMGFETKKVPTDLPYQSVDAIGDTEGEVLLGRISAENPKEFSNQVYKILQYENEPANSAYLTTGLGLGQKLDYRNWGKTVVENIKGDFPDFWQWETLYEKDAEWTREDLIEKINSNRFSEVDHDGHADYWTIMQVDSTETNLFQNTKYAFAYSHGCIAGAMDKSCMAENFTTSFETGGYFAVVFNSREGIYTPGDILSGPSIDVHRSFVEACWEKDMTYYSAFNAYSHRMYPEHNFTIRTTNYFGDAATPFRGKSKQDVSIKKDNNVKNQKSAAGMPIIRNNQLHISLQKATEISIDLLSVQGRVITSLAHKTELHAGTHSFDFSKVKLAQGTYIVHVSIGAATIVQRLVVS